MSGHCDSLTVARHIVPLRAGHHAEDAADDHPHGAQTGRSDRSSAPFGTCVPRRRTGRERRGLSNGGRGIRGRRRRRGGRRWHRQARRRDQIGCREGLGGGHLVHRIPGAGPKDDGAAHLLLAFVQCERHLGLESAQRFEDKHVLARIDGQWSSVEAFGDLLSVNGDPDRDQRTPVAVRRREDDRRLRDVDLRYPLHAVVADDALDSSQPRRPRGAFAPGSSCPLGAAPGRPCPRRCTPSCRASAPRPLRRSLATRSTATSPRRLGRPCRSAIG